MRTEMYLKSTGLYRKIFNIVLSSIIILLTSLVTVIFYGCTDDPLTPSKDDRNLETVIPEEVGYSSEKLEEVKDFSETSGSGVYHEAAAEAPIMIEMRPERGSHPPGTFYYYNNFDFNVAGTIFEQETGTKIFEEFKRKIADPIGMQDFSIDNCHYQYELDKSKHPAYVFRMSARDMARFGALYQKNGNWEGTQIIPQDWIEESTTVYSLEDSTLGAGYGYMWKILIEGGGASELLGGYRIFYHTGLGGVQALVIIPDLNLVVVQRTDTDGYFEDKELGMELGMMIVDAKL